MRKSQDAQIESALGFVDRKWLADDSLDNQAGSYALNANPDPLRSFANLHPQGLQIWTVPALRDPRGLAAVTTEVLRLAAFDLLVSLDRLLTTDGTLGTHVTTLAISRTSAY